MDNLIQSSRMSSVQLSETSNKPEDLGLVIRYDTIMYRDQEVNFLSDVSGVQCFAQWQGELIDLGLNNLYYREDMCRFIDRRLDLITTFRDYPNFDGAKLEYFHNGEYRDIRLLYKGRLIKVFLVAGDANETWIISESVKLLLKSGLIESAKLDD